MRIYAIAVAAMILLSVGQVLLKLLASRLGETGLNLAAIRAQGSSLATYGLAIMATYTAVLGCWLYVLRSLDLNRAFAFVALTFVFVPIVSYFLLGERITLGTVGGATLIIVGILVSVTY